MYGPLGIVDGSKHATCSQWSLSIAIQHQTKIVFEDMGRIVACESSARSNVLASSKAPKNIVSIKCGRVPIPSIKVVDAYQANGLTVGRWYKG